MLFIIIVLYNKKIDDRYLAYNFIEHLKCIIIFIDNSINYKIIEYNKKKYIGSNIYISSNGNIGLSKAYNRAIKFIENSVGLNDDIWIMTLDDDTYVDDKYLENLGYNIKNAKVNIICGIVKDQNEHYLSPIKLSFFNKVKYIKELGLFNDVVCINSSIAIRSTVFKKIRYDEDLFLDMIDYKFFYDLKREKQNRVLTIDGLIIQSFSGSNYKNYNNLMERYKLYKKDYSVFCEKIGINIIFKNLHLLKRKISIIIRYLCNYLKGE